MQLTNHPKPPKPDRLPPPLGSLAGLRALELGAGDLSFAKCLARRGLEVTATVLEASPVVRSRRLDRGVGRGGGRGTPRMKVMGGTVTMGFYLKSRNPGLFLEDGNFPLAPG